MLQTACLAYLLHSFTAVNMYKAKTKQKRPIWYLRLLCFSVIMHYKNLRIYVPCEPKNIINKIIAFHCMSMSQTAYLAYLFHWNAWQQNVQKRPIWSLLPLYFSIAASEICVFTTKTIYHPLTRPIVSLQHDHHLQHHYQIESFLIMHYWRA